MKERSLCIKCLKPIATCFCADIKPFETTHRFVILQHPTERRKTVGTARMAHLCLSNSLLLAGAAFGDHAEVNDLIENPQNNCVTLFPGENAQDVQTLSLQKPRKPLTIFVLDATWKIATKMLRNSPNLLALPQIRFTPKKTSEYQFRTQPMPYCLSTIESIHHILEVLEPSRDREQLLTHFRMMVKTQVTFSSTHILRRSQERGLSPTPKGAQPQ